MRSFTETLNLRAIMFKVSPGCTIYVPGLDGGTAFEDALDTLLELLGVAGGGDEFAAPGITSTCPT